MKTAETFKFRLSILLILLAALMTGRGLVCEADAAPRAFPDVAETSAYYYEPVYWALENDITTGRGGLFEPNRTCTRAEAVTFLYRFAKSPEVTGSSFFADVQDPSSWYFDAVIWAEENNITTGYGTVNGQPVFMPEVTCSRAMIVTLLERYARYVAGNYAEAAGSLAPFPDTEAGKWYLDAVRWAAENGITTGKGDGRFYPAEGCSRGQIVTFLYRYREMKGSDHVHTWVTETVVDKEAWDEKVVTREAWSEQVQVKEAWSEQVLVKEAWTEEVLKEVAWDEPVYEGFFVCARCGYATQDGGEIENHCIDAHEAEGGASYYTEGRQTGTVHHDAVYETVEHPAEYETVEHPAEYETVEHPAEYTTVHHDAETHEEMRCAGCGAAK